MRCSSQVPLGGDPEEDPGHAGGTLSPSWSGNALGFPLKELTQEAGEREVCCPQHPTSDRRKIMDVGVEGAGFE